MASPKPKGCFTTILIAIIIITSLSLAGLYLLLNTGLYDGKDADYESLAITDVDIFDGNQILVNQTVIIEGDEITCVGQDCAIPTEAKKIDGKGKSLLPGLIDMHVHFYAATSENADMSPQRQLLDYIKQRPDVRKNLHEAGVTTIRSVGDIAENILKLKQQIDYGEMVGPKVFTTGPIFTAPNGHPVSTIYKGNDVLIENGTRQAESVKEAEAWIEELAKQGVQGIKAVYDDMVGEVPKLNGEILQAIINKAHEQNLWVTVHTGTAQDIKEVVEWDVDVVEHGASDLIDSTTAKIMAENGITYVPTLATMESSFENKETLLSSERVKNITLLAKAGVPIGAGTDTYGKMTFGKSLHRELELLVEAGLTPIEALSGATKVAALSLKLDHSIGMIEKGKEADLILVNGKPWENISDIRNIAKVFQNGVQVVEKGKVID